MEEVIRGYFDACNSGDADAVAKYFAPGAVHYFPPDMYEGPFRGGETIGAKWSWAVRTLGSHWTVDEVICDPDTDRAVIEWTHEKTKTGVVLRGDEWYHFDPDSGLVTEIPRVLRLTPSDRPGPVGARRVPLRRARLCRQQLRAAK